MPMLFRHTHILALLLILYGLASCTQEIEVDFPQEADQLVVYSLFHPDSVWKVSVSSTKDLNTPFAPYEVIDQATVEVYQDDALVDVLEYQGFLEPGLVQDNVRGITYDTVFWRNETTYLSKEGLKPEVGVTYTLVVSAPGYATVRGSDRIPELPNVEVEATDISTDRDWPGFNPNDNFVAVTALIRDNLESNDYYLAGVSYMSTAYLFEDGVVIDSTYSEQYLEVETFEIRSTSINPFKLFSDQSFFGIDYPLLIGARLDQLFTLNELNSFRMHLGIVSEAFYKYYESSERQSIYSINLVNLSDPPIIHSNLDGGLGIFAGYNIIDFDVQF